MKTEKDYSKFRLYPTNRAIAEPKVKKLMESIKKHGYIEGKEIIVNKKMEIIDGQHRYAACRQLGLPINYVMHNNGSADSDLIIDLNQNQTNWSLHTYVLHWAREGVKFHQVVMDFENRYHFGITNSLEICAAGHKPAKSIRGGENLAINDKREQVAEFVVSVSTLPFYKSLHFISAIKHLIKKGKKEDIKKLLKHHMTIRQQPSRNAYLAVFENIINKHRSPDDRISLS